MAGYGSAAKVALKISGYSGVHADQVNASYEPMGFQHNGKPCWAARISMGACYIHHTGKGRWVVNKRLDQENSSRCYAFLADDGGADPSACKGHWTLPGQDGQWKENPSMSCSREQASTDIFVRLRARVEQDMRDFGLIDKNQLKQLWRSLDKNGNNVVSLAEIDCLVVDMTKAQTWPSWVNNKSALRRAYYKTTKVDGTNSDDWVEKSEFHALLLNIFWFGHLHELFAKVDSDGDDKIDEKELKAGLSNIGLQLSDAEAHNLFADIDRNHGGSIMFVEFCAYARKRICPDHNPDFDKDLNQMAHACHQHMRKSEHGENATAGHFVQKKSLGGFDDLENKIKSDCKDHAKLKALWSRLDFNGNNVVSLAEIDKMVVENYPLLNHKPALMRAYKATIWTKKERDEFVHRKDFKCLILNLFYFNKLFWLFDQVDEDKDRRLTCQEFKWCLSVAGCKMSDSKAQAEFKKVDANGGGKVLFDEFCKYFTSKMAPEAAEQFLA